MLRCFAGREYGSQRKGESTCSEALQHDEILMVPRNPDIRAFAEVRCQASVQEQELPGEERRVEMAKQHGHCFQESLAPAVLHGTVVASTTVNPRYKFHCRS